MCLSELTLCQRMSADKKLLIDKRWFTLVAVIVTLNMNKHMWRKNSVLMHEISVQSFSS